MREIRVDAPRVIGDRLEVAWRVDPATDLYTRTRFSMRLPGPIPDRVAWTIALLCLHPHWALLRPCRVLLPVRLAPGEAEFWLRLVDAQIVTLEAHRGGRDTARTIEIVESGASIANVAPLEERGLCAAAFSGGKDSLLQAGLLAELCPDALLVTTTSPMPPLRDHETARRRHVLREIVARRRNLSLVEVQSDFRACWKNDFPPDAGYPVAVNELTDTFLYLASLIAAAWTRGATHLFLASEGEVQENIEFNGSVVQHPHAMYSVATQGAVSALLARIGMRCGSLISPLRSHQVQQLLWKRYGDLSDLQYSCWRVGDGDATCSRCSQCLRIAFAALSAGEDPRRMGIDLDKLLAAMKRWAPRIVADAQLPNDRVASALHAQTARTIASTPWRALATWNPLTLARFLRLRARMPDVGAPPGYRPAYLAHVDPLVRDEIAEIYAGAFAAEDAEEMRARGETLTRWITEPLDARPAALPGPEPILEGKIIRVAETILDGNELRYVTECIRTNWVSSEGPFVRRFEDAFASAVGCRYGVACSSGTAALHLVMAALKLGPGDEVILPTFTMIATANAVRYVGATPVLVDAEPRTWNMNVAAVARKITSRTRAIVAVHTYGHPVDIDPLRELAARHGLHLIEDAAEAHGATYRGRAAGSLGDAAIFSFYGNKIITSGEGGMVTTNDARIADLARQLRGHAFSPDRHFWHEHLGYNYRMTNLQAAVGLAQTERMATLIEARRRNARRYRERLSHVPGLTLPIEAAGVTNVFWMFTILVEDTFGITRDELRGALARRGIETRTTFIPIHLQPIYRDAFRGQTFPVAEELCRKGLYLPSGPRL
ncbi:MAG TPA: aminotransferase class I/II-fold pyridoxal phosphate-dependent enzyme, partial [Thermoanaerobaculia bacterium]|nr:aminotransferase class I/II-fold pyridoxal phosphate-dependent enzyme [Thermoanaerobaculia bacterium]